MFEQATAQNSRAAWVDWLLRIGIALAFAAFGREKFTGPEWVKIFQQIGFGQWFRYFTGVVEILGGALVLLPWTATAGLALLACTMGSATLLWAFRLGQPANCIITGAFCAGLVLFGLNRRS
jgi:putative oxidoreductase